MKKILLSAAIALLGFSAWAQVPDKPEPPRAINDLAHMFDSVPAERVQALEDSLQSFAKRTSNQIVIVTLADLADRDINQLATDIGQKWGVGDEVNHNGVVILIKPKTAKESGDIGIAVGEGLEGALPDGAVADLLDKVIIPHFADGDYFGGVEAAVGHIVNISSKEYSSKGEKKDTGGGIGTGLLIVGGGLGAYWLLRRRNKKIDKKQQAADATEADTGATPKPDGKEGPAAAATAAASATAAALATDIDDEPEEEEDDDVFDDDDDDTTPEEEEKDQYRFGGGKFSGAGAHRKW